MAELIKNALLSADKVFLKPTYFYIEPNVESLEATQLTIHDPLICSIGHDLPMSGEIEEYESAFNQGLTEGLEKANQQMQDQTKKLEHLFANISTEISANRQQLSTEIADIVLIILRQFFINQQLNTEAIANQINQTIAQINNKENITLALHPEDLALLQQGLLKPDLSQCTNLRIIPNEQLSLGGCLITTEHGTFDAGIERQIDSLKQVLLQIKQKGIA